MQNVNQIVNTIQSAKRYKNIYRPLIQRITQQELGKRKDIKQDVKSIKNKIHQIHGAFDANISYKKIYAKIKEAHDLGDNQHIKKELESTLKLHSSTRERLTNLKNFYTKIFSTLKFESDIDKCHLQDLACGLNPLSIIYLDFPKNIQYTAYDIDLAEIEFLNQIFQLFSYNICITKPIDLIQEIPQEKTDITFLLKTIPCLEQQQKGSSLKVLQKLNTSLIIASFPTSNLGRHKTKGNMKQFYENTFNQIVRRQPWQIQKIDFPTELVFIIQK